MKDAYQPMTCDHQPMKDDYHPMIIARIAQGKIKKKYAIDDEREAVREALATWMSGAVKDQPFAGGERPNMADVCVFGAHDLNLNLDLNLHLDLDLDLNAWSRGHERLATWTRAASESCHVDTCCI